MTVVGSGADTGSRSSRPVSVSAPVACRALLADRGGSAPAVAVVTEDDTAGSAGVAVCARPGPSATEDPAANCPRSP
jgi:hypothetical protein